MQSLVDQLKAQIPPEQILPLIEKKMEEYHHLITLESAYYLVALEKFGVGHSVQNIERAKMTASPTVLHVRIKKIYVPQVYRRGIQESRSQRIEVEDESGDCTIVAYDSASLELAKTALAGDIIEIGPLKYRGKEFHTGQNCSIKRMQKGQRFALLDQRKLLGNFEGEIIEVGGDFTYRRGQSTLSGTAQTEIATAFEIKDKSGKVRVVYWNSGGIEKSLKKGMMIEIENGLRKNGEIHIGMNSRLVYSPIVRSRPRIKDVKIEGEKVSVLCGEKTLVFDDLEHAAIKFGIGQVPQGISPQTAIELKTKELIGKEIPAEWENC